MPLSIVILAAGQGKRMHSQLPKVLHRLAGKPLLEHVVETAQKLSPDQIAAIYGHQGDALRHKLAHLNIQWVHQAEQLGTGHALLQALPQLPANHRVLVLYGDVPLISVDTLEKLIHSTPETSLGLITAFFTDPSGLGRIIRDDHHQITDIIEQKDLSSSQQATNEINTGIYLFPAQFLQRALSKLQNHNAQNEYYLTDVIKQATQEKLTITSIQPASLHEVTGINDRLQLSKLERVYQLQQAEKLLQKGVTLLDPYRFDIRGELRTGTDVQIDINVVFEGHVKIGDRCVIGPNCFIRNTIIGNNVEIKANSVIDGAEIGDDCIIGPFARLRPGSILAPQVHIGNFVELKNALVGLHSKVNHLSYIGDCDIGSKVNIGAGTITCNYDGINKHRTIIENEAFIGSNTSLVAPVSIGERATIGAGSTITRNAPPHQLTLCRAQQRSIEHWQRPKKKES